MKYYTYKKDALAAALPGQKVNFKKGKGYYVTGTPTPTGVVVTPPQGMLVVEDGKGSAESYQSLYQPQALAGGSIGGLDLRNYKGYGISVMSWNPASKGKPWLIHDGKVSGISATPPRSRNGTAEAGLWIGQNDVEVARWIFGPGNAWMDLWTGSLCDNAHLHDLLFEHPELVAIYHEHSTTHALVEKFKILQGSSTQSNPINVEWTYGGVGSNNIHWQEFEIYCPAGATGIFMDAGTWGCIVGDPTGKAPKCVFTGPGDAIGIPNHLAGAVKNLVATDNIIFKNAGKQIYYHNNQIGLGQSKKELHPHTMRNKV